MSRNPNILFLCQAASVLCMLAAAAMGFVITGILLHLQEPCDRKRPGINIKEF